ncbi:MAG: SRPBCC family protein [Nitrosomonadales bacterium]|nr:SRPBCC family protein [Nitrosomonadales bacterium]
MSLVNISASSLIPAPPQRVYDIIADYRNGHPHIIPPKHFRNLVVEEGGIGAGTKIRFEMVLLGKVQQAQSVITEPEAGRVLVESTTDGLAVTRFIVEPHDGGKTSHVTISTELKSQGLIGNAILRFLFRRIYAEELALLAEYAVRGARRS